MAHVTSRRFTTRTTAKADVKVYSNAATLRLALNGADLGERPVVDHVALWPAVALTEGENRLTVTDAGVVRDEVVWTYRLAP